MDNTKQLEEILLSLSAITFNVGLFGPFGKLDFDNPK
jgi:hypothetical protein